MKHQRNDIHNISFCNFIHVPVSVQFVHLIFLLCSSSLADPSTSDSRRRRIGNP